MDNSYWQQQLKAAQTAQATVPQWYWDRDGVWIKYNQVLNATIESAYSANAQGSVQVNIANTVYTIYFQEGKQKRQDNESRYRRVKRVLVNVSSDDSEKEESDDSDDQQCGDTPTRGVDNMHARDGFRLGKDSGHLHHQSPKKGETTAPGSAAVSSSVIADQAARIAISASDCIAACLASLDQFDGTEANWWLEWSAVSKIASVDRNSLEFSKVCKLQW